MATTGTGMLPLQGLGSPTQDKTAVVRSESPIRRTARHTKGLSLNFPILLPSHQSSQTSSPRATSPVNGSARASPHQNADIFTTTGPIPSPTQSGADILTLVATQERRVLELREELAKAETELDSLKKQWTLYEANKKRDEERQVRKVPVNLDAVPSPKPMNDEEVEEERKRRRALVEMNNNTAHQASASIGGKLGRKGSQRVFEGRHTRALSLLSPTSHKQSQSMPASSIDELIETEALRSSDEIASHQTPTLNLSRMTTLEGFISPDSLQQTFGKTYKDLAAHRKSLPPVSADMFMKSGKQVVDGVREGLWTFFEDIRQATVGDEAINGPSTQSKPRRHSRDPNKPGRQKRKSSKSLMQNGGGLKEASFWTEFGLDTPGKPSASPPMDNRNGHVQQKSSTDSQNPPDLLADTNENDEDWENWESPITTKLRTKDGIEQQQTEDGLSWPELKKNATPSQFNRTVSDLIREWNDDGVGQVAEMVQEASPPAV